MKLILYRQSETFHSKLPDDRKGMVINMKKCDLGEIILDLRPQPEIGNPRNSEGAFISLEDGTLLFAYSKFKGKDPADHATSDICLLYSYDDGNTFGNEKTILTCEGENGINIMSLSFMHMLNGDIGLFYLVRENRAKLQMFLRRSSDGGVTWSDRVLCTPLDAFFVVNNDRVIRLANGNIVIPAAYHQTMGVNFDEHSELRYFISEDDGRTWYQAPGKCILSYTNNSCSGLQEPGLLELNPNQIWSWARTDLGRQYETFSMDGGKTWTECQPSRFSSPKSPLSMKRDNDGNIFAIWNPIPEYNGRDKVEGIFLGGRTPFVMAVSTDNGLTFSEPVAFESDEERGYCYCAIHFHKDYMLLAYCAGGVEDLSCLTRCRLRRIPMEQLRKEFALN